MQRMEKEALAKISHYQGHFLSKYCGQWQPEPQAEVSCLQSLDLPVAMRLLISDLLSGLIGMYST